MNTIKQLLVFSLAIILTLPACRKGEDDPGLSLRSRDARLTGEWNVNKHEHIFTIKKISENIQTGATRDTTIDITTVYEGVNYFTTWNVRADEGNYNEIYTELDSTQYTVTLTIEEGGKFILSKIGTTTEQLQVEEIYNGNWSWANADKKKVMLNLNFQGEVQTFYIRELRKDVLRMERSWDEYNDFISTDQSQGIIYLNNESQNHEEFYDMSKND